MLQIIQKRKIYYIISSILVLGSILSLIIWGLKPSIDFIGGSLLEIEYQNTRPESGEIKESLKNISFDGDLVVQLIGEKGVILRFKNIEEEKHQEVIDNLKNLVVNDEEGQVIQQTIVEKRFESVGPSIGQELQKKAVYSIIIVNIAIILYVAWAFRKVSYPVASWKYGLIAVIALFHDILITLGIFSILGHFWGIEIGLPFIAALLTILGYSVNDTIVVFDRIRENLFRMKNEKFEDVVNISVNQTFRRSLFTSLTTLLVLFAIYIFGGESIKYFVLALIIGIISGTYSSIFIASPILATWQEYAQKIKLASSTRKI